MKTKKQKSKCESNATGNHVWEYLRSDVQGDVFECVYCGTVKRDTEIND